MYCKKCGKKIDDDSIFCRYCGCKVTEIDPNASMKSGVYHDYYYDKRDCMFKRIFVEGVDEVINTAEKDGKIWSLCKLDGKYGVKYGDNIIIPFIYDYIFYQPTIYGKYGNNASCLICTKGKEKGIISSISGTVLAPFGEFEEIKPYSCWPERYGFSIEGKYKTIEGHDCWIEDIYPDNYYWYELEKPEWKK